MRKQDLEVNEFKYMPGTYWEFVVYTNAGLNDQTAKKYLKECYK